MNPIRIPSLTADNLEPYLWHAVMLLQECHIDSARVRLILAQPESPFYGHKEIFDQKPAAHTPIDPDMPIEISVNPDCGYFVETKQNWYRQQEAGALSPDVVSRNLWMLAEIQLLFRSPPDLVNTLLGNSGLDTSLFSERNQFGDIFSGAEQKTLASLLPYKRNSHHPAVLSLLFSSILNLDIQFSRTLNNNFPQILSARVKCSPENLDCHKRNQIRVLEELLVPATCTVIYTYQYPLIILNSQDAILDRAQLGQVDQAD